MKKIPSTLQTVVAFCLAGLPAMAPQEAQAQNQGPAVEQWRSFLPYNQVNALATNGDNSMIYCATEYGFFTYNRQDGSLEPYSKVNGMHDIGMSDVAYDDRTKSVLLAYTNGNIDLFSQHQFYNLPDLKISQISGNKTIYAATAGNGTAYVSTGIGLMLVNMAKREVRFTVSFYSGSLFATVYDAVLHDGRLYAATNLGLFRTDTANAFMQDYSSWEKQSGHTFTHIAFADNHLYAAAQDSVWVYEEGDSSFHFFYRALQEVSHLDEGDGGLWVSQSDPDGKQAGHCYLLDTAAQVKDSVACFAPAAVLRLPSGELWYADNSDYNHTAYSGLRKRLSATESESYTPAGPVSANAFDISAYDGTIWVAHGGYTSWRPLHNRSMFSVYQDNHWKNFSWVSDNDWVQDFCRILYDPQSGHTYAGSLTGGLVDVASDQSFQVYNNGYLPETYANPGLYSISGLALDPSGNLWMTSNGGSGRELTMKTPDGHWYPMKGVPGNTQGDLPHSAADVLMDDYGQLWFITTTDNGVVVYDPNGTPEQNSDDRYRILRTGEGHGNLPNDQATCIAKTRSGTIWIGTTNGIGIVNCPGDVIDGACETSLNPVKMDNFADDWLFVRQSITALAVDGADRKWVGSGNGVWLLNTDGSTIKTVYRFTTDNSPLPSNQIRHIDIDPVTGDVYFSTDKGFVAFRSTATEAPKTSPPDLLVYPNPVPSGYQGQIAVRGVPDGADVRFTDISGKLVYRTTAFGGQAVWNGQDYTGHKVQSGVYLVFIVGKDGSEKMTTKIMVQH